MPDILGNFSLGDFSLDKLFSLLYLRLILKQFLLISSIWGLEKVKFAFFPFVLINNQGLCVTPSEDLQVSQLEEIFSLS